VCKFEVQEHHDSGLGIETGQRYYSNPYRNAHVVAEQVEKPERSYKRERHCQEDDRCLDKRLCVEINEDKDNEQGERDNDLQPFMGLHEVFVFSTPFETISRRYFKGSDLLLGIINIAAHIPAGK